MNPNTTNTCPLAELVEMPIDIAQLNRGADLRREQKAMLLPAITGSLPLRPLRITVRSFASLRR